MSPKANRKKPDTNPLKDEADLPESRPRRVAYGAEALPIEVVYRPVPVNPSLVRSQSKPWRIQLVAEDGEVLGLDIYGDVILGRGEKVRAGNGVDLTPLGAQEKGVSRRHALLRPTSSRLYLIDLVSTNGTLHNSVPVGPGIARVLSDGDVIMLGALTLVVRLIEVPIAFSSAKTLDLGQSGDETRGNEIPLQ
jgi:hypothetical protein